MQLRVPSPLPSISGLLFAAACLASAAPVAAAPLPEAELTRQLDRISFPARPKQVWTVVPHDEGLIVVGEGEDGWSVSGWDTELQQLWSAPLPEAAHDEPLGTAVGAGRGWLLYGKGRELALVGIDLDDGDTVVHSFRGPRKAASLLGLEVVGGEAWLVTGNRQSHLGGTGTLMHVDLDSGRAQELRLPLDVRKPIYQRLSRGEDGTVAISVRSERRRRRTQHLLSGADGRVTPQLTLSDEVNLLTAERLPLADGSSVVVGSYADEARGRGAQGIYLARVDASGRVGPVEPHSFSELAHFFDHLSDRRQEVVAKRIERKQEKGKDLDLDALFDVHEAVLTDDGLVVVGEAFHPVYTTYTTTQTVTVNGATTTTVVTTTVFVGWRFTHAVAVAFDGAGHVAWDASIPIENVLSGRIEPHVRAVVDGDRITFVYPARRKLYTRVLEGGEVVEDKAQQQMTGAEDEVARKVRDVEIAPWTDQAFVAWGYEKTDSEGRVFAVERLGPVEGEPAVTEPTAAEPTAAEPAVEAVE